MRASKILATTVTVVLVLATPFAVGKYREHRHEKLLAIEVGMLESDVRREVGAPGHVETPESGETCQGKTVSRILVYELGSGSYLLLSIDERGFVACRNFRIVKI